MDCRPLDRIDAEDELQITSARADGTLRAYRKIWVVRIGEDLYVRSVNGRGADWFRHVVAAGGGRIRCSGVECDVKVDERGEASTGAVDDAYLTKYARYGERLVRTMLRPPVVEATLRLVPAARRDDARRGTAQRVFGLSSGRPAPVVTRFGRLSRR